MWFTTYYVNMSIFLAFAACYPNMEIMLYFIIPLKIKYLAVIDVLFLLYQTLISSWSERVAILVSLLNFVIFFFTSRNYKSISPKEYARKKAFKKAFERGPYYRGNQQRKQGGAGYGSQGSAAGNATGSAAGSTAGKQYGQCLRTGRQRRERKVGRISRRPHHEAQMRHMRTYGAGRRSAGVPLLQQVRRQLRILSGSSLHA